ncbi:MAG: HAD family phosphatase [Nitrospirales bacterium]|nr:HAD family phosphatase [Nitrospirales bacterium]
MIDAIIFDCEGVIADTETIWDEAQEEFLRRRGAVYSREKTKHLLTGRSVVEGVKVMQAQYGFEGDPEALAQERIEIVKDLMGKETQFIPGFKLFFERVRDNYKTCIATSMTRELLDIVVLRLGLKSLFGGRIFSLTDTGGRSKPHPDLFLYAAQKIGARPENCLVIEDAPYGVEAAKRAEMRSVALTTTYDRSLLSSADIVVDSFDELDLSKLW